MDGLISAALNDVVEREQARVAAVDKPSTLPPPVDPPVFTAMGDYAGGGQAAALPAPEPAALKSEGGAPADAPYTAMGDYYGGGSLNPAPSIALSGVAPRDPEPSPSPASSGGLYDAALGDIVRQENERLAGALETARTSDPERYAKAKTIADRDGLPLDYVAENLPDLQSRQSANEVRKILEGSPGLRQWLTTGDNAKTVKFDELSRLSGLPWMWSAATEALGSGNDQLDAAEIRYRQIYGKASPEEIARATTIEQQENRDYGADGWLDSGLVQLAKMVPQFVGGAAYGIKRSSQYAALGGSMGAIGGAVIGGPVGAGGGLTAGFLTGARFGATRGYMEYSTIQEAGGALSEFLNMKTEDGRPLDPRIAKIAALGVGYANAALETTGMHALEKLLPGFDQTAGALFRGITRDSVKAALRQPAFRDAITTFLSGTGKAMGTEVATEVMQEAVTLMGGLLAQKVDGGQFQPIEGREIANRLGETAVKTAQAMSILTPVLASPRLGADIRVARRSDAMRELYAQANASAAESVLRTANPPGYADAVRSMLGDGKADTVFVPVEKMTEMFQSMDLTPADIEKRFDGFERRYAEALATGGDVAIPMADYQTHIAGTPLGEALIDHQKWHPELLTPAQARQTIEDHAEVIEDVYRRVGEAMQEREGERATSERVRDDVYAQLVNIGTAPDTARTQAALYEATFRTLAARTGLDAWELYQERGLEIRRAMPDGLDYRKTDELDLALDAIRKGGGVGKARDRATRARKAAMGPSLADFLVERGGLSEGQVFTGELAARDLSTFKKGRLVAKDGGGLDFDTAALAAIEAGYLPEHVTEGQNGEWDVSREGSIETMMRAIDEEVAGRDTRHAVREWDARIDPNVERQDALAAMLDELGLDPSALTNDQIRTELGKATAQNAEQGALFQTTGASDLAGQRSDKRGSIQFTDGRTIISLFERADLSTFLHETGHLYAEILKTLGEAPDANERIRQDWETVREHIGAEAGQPISREAHELFAKSFERYLMEGRAPSADLRGTFERFKSWLTWVYRSVSRLGVEVSPELRGVFDRLIATDEEIYEAGRAPEYAPLFKDAAEAGMTQAQWRAYQDAAQAATDRAKQDMQARMLADVRRETTKQWRDAKAATREEVIADLSTRPVFQVQHFIRTGEFLGEPGVAPPEMKNRRLQRDWLVNRFGQGVLTRLPRTVPPIYSATGGIHPDEMAEMFGFRSGEHMVEEMLSAPSFARAVNGRVEELMRERHGDLLSNQAAQAAIAHEAMANDERGVFLETEMKALAAKGGIKGPQMPRQAARQLARDLIRSKKVAEGSRVSVFDRATVRAAKEAEKAILSGDFKAAAEWKRRQLLNHYLTMESQKAKAEMEAARSYLDKFTGRKRPPGVDPEYLDQIEGILDRFEFRQGTSLRQIERRKSLSEFIAEREAAGDMFIIGDDLRSDAALVSYKDMTIEDLSALRDVVKNVEHLGRLKNRLLEKGRLRAFGDMRDQLVRGALTQPDIKRVRNRNPSGLEKFKQGVMGLDAYLLRMEQVFQWLDNGDVNGPWTRIVFQRFVDAENAKFGLQKEYAAKLKTILDGAGDMTERKVVPNAGGLSFTRGELYAIALNQGSESNRQKLLAGEAQMGERSFRSEAEMNAALSLLTKEDWDRVQSMWDTIEGLWPHIAAVERRITGVEPPRVERRQVETAHGTYRGGYYPMVYDPAEAGDVQRRNDAAADKLFDNTYLRPATAHGFTKARVENYSRPVLLDMRALTSHIDAVIHDVTHREAVRDVYKLVSDKQVEGAIRQTMGPAVYGEMNKWLQRIANDRGAPENAFMSRVVNAARTNMSLYAMGFRLTTAMSQIAGFSNSMELVKPSHLAGAVAETIRRPLDTWQFVQAQSGEMRHRSDTLERDVRAGLQQLEGKSGPLNTMRQTAFYMIGMMDRVVTVPTWLGAYNQHLAENAGDTEGAVRAGDRAVRLTQGSGSAKDLAGIMGAKDNLTRSLTMFYSYFNLQYNRLRTLGRDARGMVRDGSYEDLPHLVARSIALIIGPAILSDMLVGRIWDDDENPAWWAFKKVSLYPFMSIPLARDIASSIDSGFGYKFTPLARAPETAIKLGGAIHDAFTGDLDARMTAKYAAELSGYVFGLPLGQFVGTADNVWQGIDKNDFKVRDLFLSRRALADDRDK